MTAAGIDESWRWPTHDGGPALTDADYLVAPEPAIGPVSSAQTNCTQGGACIADRRVRLTMYELGAVALVLATCVAAWRVHLPHLAQLLPWEPGPATDRAIIWGAGISAALAGALLAWLFRPRYSSYIGALGLQLHVRRPGLPARRRVMRFADCARLRVETTRHHLNGSYQHTSYRYAWFDARDTRVFVIAGRHDDRRPPEPSDPVLFARAAERAWQAWRRRE